MTETLAVDAKEEEKTQTVRTIRLGLPLRLGQANCYLVSTAKAHVLIDAGPSRGRGALEGALAEAGCSPGGLRLIVITHGDFDHIGNAAHLRTKYGARIAMHRGDLGMAERGDMFWNRRKGNAVLRVLVRALLRFPKADRFTPDVLLEDGMRLTDDGLDAVVVSIPGHSAGSVGVLTDDGSLFCGDLLENTKEPAFNAIMDDPATGWASVGRLKGLAARTVYPGHGAPFPAERIPSRQPAG